MSAQVGVCTSLSGQEEGGRRDLSPTRGQSLRPWQLRPSRLFRKSGSERVLNLNDLIVDCAVVLHQPVSRVGHVQHFHPDLKGLFTIEGVVVGCGSRSLGPSTVPAYSRRAGSVLSETGGETPTKTTPARAFRRQRASSLQKSSKRHPIHIPQRPTVTNVVQTANLSAFWRNMRLGWTTFVTTARRSACPGPQLDDVCNTQAQRPIPSKNTARNNLTHMPENTPPTPTRYEGTCTSASKHGPHRPFNDKDRPWTPTVKRVAEPVMLCITILFNDVLTTTSASDLQRPQ